MANNNIGAKRIVVGASYGLRDWLAQRVTAIVMALYTIVLLGLFLTGSNFSYFCVFISHCIQQSDEVNYFL